MEAKNFFSTQNSRIGFHYFPDTLHYRESDLRAWLPQLKAFQTSWLVIHSELQRAIPEVFIVGLVKAGIQPVIQFDINLERPPKDAELSLLLSAYKRWGAKYVILSQRPNSYISWNPVNWANRDLVEHFLEHYLPLARLALGHGMLPLMPPLQPGGNYWDTSFLRVMLQSLMEKKENELLEKFILSAFPWTQGHSLNWGAGGPAQWPDARPYALSAGEQDQRGFHVFDWYQTIFQEVVGQTCPIFLLQAGAAHDPAQSHLMTDVHQHADINLAIVRLLKKEQISTPEDPKVLLRPIDDAVVSCNFWLLAASPSSLHAEDAWFMENRRPKPIVDSLEEYLNPCKETQTAVCGCRV